MRKGISIGREQPSCIKSPCFTTFFFFFLSSAAIFLLAVCVIERASRWDVYHGVLPAVYRRWCSRVINIVDESVDEKETQRRWRGFSYRDFCL